MTAQSPDWLHYKGQRHDLFSNPLESFFDDDHPRPDFKATDTACWRGYDAEWEVEDDTLYLVGLDGWVGGDEDTYAVNALHVGLEYLFPWAAGRVKATWFTGVLRIPQGEQLEYVHAGYGSMYEEDLLLSFEAGKLVRTEIKDNRQEPEIQKRQRLAEKALRRQVSMEELGRRTTTSASTQECPFCHKRLSIDYKPEAKLSCSDCGASLTIDPSRKAVGRPRQVSPDLLGRRTTTSASTQECPFCHKRLSIDYEPGAKLSCSDCGASLTIDPSRKAVGRSDGDEV